MFGVLKLGKLGASMKKAGFNPRTLFAASEPGAWYDPSDMSTLFQDSAGTTPVTAVGQPVGLILDKSGRGNHAFQATATSRPVLQQDASGRYYLSFDGTDDWLSTASINFTGTDKMTVFAGVRKLSDANAQVCFEFGTNVNSVGGSFGLFTPGNIGSPDISWTSRGTATSAAVANGNPAPLTKVVAGSADISGDLLSLRLNATQAAQSILNQGTGNYGNYPLYIGCRGGTTAPFNGRIYSLIVRGAQSTEQQIASAEAWVNTKTGAY